jgi:hypothetical protein
MGGNHQPGATVLNYGMNSVLTGMTRQVGRQWVALKQKQRAMR